MVETWAIHNRIHLYIVDALDENALAASLTPKSRSVYAFFAHLHNVRLMWLKSAQPDLLIGLEKIEPKPVGTAADIRDALTASGKAVETLLRQALANDGAIKGFKPHAVAFLGYMIAHESHHRGQIEMVLKQTGNTLDDKVSYGVWEWGVR